MNDSFTMKELKRALRTSIPGVNVPEPPISGDRVQAYFQLFLEHEKRSGFIGTSDYGLWALAELYARKEARGEISYEEFEEELYPRSWLVRMREIPPEPDFE